MKRLGGPESAQQFDTLLAECQPLMEAASALPSLSLRSDKWAAVTMLRSELSLRTFSGFGAEVGRARVKFCVQQNDRPERISIGTAPSSLVCPAE